MYREYILNVISQKYITSKIETALKYKFVASKICLVLSCFVGECEIGGPVVEKHLNMPLQYGSPYCIVELSTVAIAYDANHHHQ